MIPFSPAPGLVVLVFLVVAFLLLRWPEVGTLFALLLLYLNLPANAVKLYGLPYPIAAGAAVLLVPALVQTFFIRRSRALIDRPFLLMIVFLGALVISSLFVKDSDLALLWIQKYLTEGLLLYFLVINLVRNRHALRRVTWVLLFAGAFLASLTLYQELTHNYSNEFGGLAQRTLEREKTEDILFGKVAQPTQSKIRLANRAQGPIDDPNRYAQLLIVLLPLGWFRIRDERGVISKVLAATFSTLILSGVLLTYSRGGFLGVFVIVGLMTMMRCIRPYQLLLATALLIVSIPIIAPGYKDRILTLRGLQGVISPEASVETDAVERGRAAEMLAAWNVFRDYPIVGVGPGQFAPIYSLSYLSENYSLRRIVEQRRAHSLYLEIMAETGAVGIVAFMAIVLVVMRRLAQTRRHLAATHAELANFSTAFLLAISAYMTTAIFLQLSYHRYFWLLIALAGVTVQVSRSLSLPVDPRQTSGSSHQTRGPGPSTPIPSM